MRCRLQQTLGLIVSVVRTSAGGTRPSIKAINRTMSSKSTGLMFQLKVNPISGNSEWVVIEEEVDDVSPEPMLASTSYLDMLNDSSRNKAYRSAIDKIVSKHCHVLDIGSGTGLLSMMAARAMSSDDVSSSKGTVTACESYIPMVKLMKKVLRANNMNHKIRVLNKRSDELEVGVDIDSRADVLVSEILDSELLGEGLIPTLQHAHDKLLVENYKTVPYRATTYGQLVESTYLWKLHDLYHNEGNSTDSIHLVPKGKETFLRVKPQQFAMHCDALSEEIRLLSEPFKIFDFNFWKRPDSHGETQVHIKATNNGTVHAVISWWVLQLDEDGKIFYSTSPKWINSPIPNNKSPSNNWCDHWKQCVWFTKGKGLPVSKDEDVCMDAIHTDISISYEFKSQLQRSEVDHHELSIQDSHITLNPERIAIYGDNHWRITMLKAINNALKGKESPLCVIADDSVFLSVAVAHVSKTSHIISLFPGLGEKGYQYLQAVADENGYSMDRVQVINTRKQQLTMNDTHQNKVDLLIAEPYYFGAEGMLPWHGLQFWSKRTMLDSMLSEDVCIMPCKGILKACAMSLPDLWRSRRALENIEGFDHMMVNTTLGSSSESPCLPFFIWQCGEIEKLSDTYTIMEFDFLKPLSSFHGKAKVEFTEAGACHGFALWIDWVMDSTTDIVMSTGPDQRYWKQGVKLLAEPLKIVQPGILSTVIEAYFDSSSSELIVSNR